MTEEQQRKFVASGCARLVKPLMEVEPKAAKNILYLVEYVRELSDENFDKVRKYLQQKAK